MFLIERKTMLFPKSKFHVFFPAQELILNHQRLKPLEKTTLISQLSMIASMLTEFASTQFLFLSLTKEDQVSLLPTTFW